MHFRTLDTDSYNYKYIFFNVIQDQEACKKQIVSYCKGRKQIVSYCKGRNMKRVQFIT
jgi:hypothetical protein